MATPAISQTSVQPKPWGETRCVHRDQTHEVWHATIQQGGFSSKHYHERKPNLFYVLSGSLRVTTYLGRAFAEYRQPATVYDLKPGDRVTVDDHVWHKFEALEDTVLIEVYWACLKGEDIVREDEGGLRTC